MGNDRFTSSPGRRPLWRIPFLGLVVGLLVLLLLLTPILIWKGQLANFYSFSTLQGLMHDSSVPAVVALGMLLIIISGGIDLSVGSVVALVTVATMQVYRLLEVWGVGVGWTSLASLGVGIGVGGLCGLVNGLTITWLRVTPFMATLGMMSVARGLAYGLAGRTQVSFRGARPEWVTTLQVAEVRGLSLFDPGVWSALVLAGLVALVLRYTIFGRYCYALGSNEATARLCGINCDRYKLGIYVLAGLLTGWAGILVFANSSSGNPSSSHGLELEVIAAVVIGGASLAGGQGSVVGTLLGVLMLSLLATGISFCGQPVETKFIVIGLVVVLNYALSQWHKRGSE